jgi:hypothetical protein
MFYFWRDDYQVALAQREILSADLGQQATVQQEEELLAVLVRFGFLSACLAGGERHDGDLASLGSLQNLKPRSDPVDVRDVNQNRLSASPGSVGTLIACALLSAFSRLASGNLQGFCLIPISGKCPQ